MKYRSEANAMYYTFIHADRRLRRAVYALWLRILKELPCG